MKQEHTKSAEPPIRGCSVAQQVHLLSQLRVLELMGTRSLPTPGLCQVVNRGPRPNHRQVTKAPCLCKCKVTGRQQHLESWSVFSWWANCTTASTGSNFLQFPGLNESNIGKEAVKMFFMISKWHNSSFAKLITTLPRIKPQGWPFLSLTLSTIYYPVSYYQPKNTVTMLDKLCEIVLLNGVIYVYLTFS